MNNERGQERPITRGIRETAQIVGLSPSFIRKAIDAGHLRSTRIGRRVLVKDADLRAWIERGSSSDTDNQTEAGFRR
jgi:excisionase family DNA binding protein